MKTFVNLRRWTDPLSWQSYFKLSKKPTQTVNRSQIRSLPQPSKTFQRIRSYDFWTESMTSGSLITFHPTWQASNLYHRPKVHFFHIHDNEIHGTYGTLPYTHPTPMFPLTPKKYASSDTYHHKIASLQYRQCQFGLRSHTLDFSGNRHRKRLWLCPRNLFCGRSLSERYARLYPSINCCFPLRPRLPG